MSSTYELSVQTTNLLPIITATATATKELSISVDNLSAAVAKVNYSVMTKDMQDAVTVIADLNEQMKELQSLTSSFQSKNVSPIKKLNIEKVGEAEVIHPTRISNRYSEGVNKGTLGKLKKRTDDIKKSAEETKKSFVEMADGFGNSADKAVMAVDSISGAFGGGSSGLSGVVGDVIELIKNPMTAAIAGIGVLIGGLVKLGKQVYDNLTLSTELLQEQINTIGNWNNQKQDKHRQTSSLMQQLIDLMKKMSKDGIFDTMLLIRALTIIKRLKKLFKLLGIAVSDEHFASILDAVKKGGNSGKWAASRLQYLKDFGRSLTTKRLAQLAADLQVRMGAQLLANSNFINIVGAKRQASSTSDTVLTLNINRAKNTNDITKYRFNAAEWTLEIIYTDYGAHRAKTKRDPLRVAFEKLWNRLMDEQDFTGVINLLKELYKKAKTKDDQQTIISIINALEQQIAKNEKAALTREKVDSLTITDLGRYVLSSKAEMLKKIKERKNKYLEKRQAKNEQLKTIGWDDSQVIADETKKINDINKLQTKRSDYLKKLNKTIAEWLAYAEKLVSKWKKDPNSVSMKLIIRANRYLSVLYERKAKTEGRIVDLQLKLLDSRFLINRRLKLAANWTREQYNNNIDQANQLSYLADKDYKGYYKYKDDLIIENSGKHLSKKQKKLFYEGQQLLRTTQARYNLRKQMDDFYHQIFSSIDPKAANKAKLIDEFKKTKGKDLTKIELDSIDKLVDLQFKFDLNKNGTKLDLSDATIKTNDLTRRGGMQYGAVAPDVDRVNTMIANNIQTNNNTLLQIKQDMKRVIDGLKI